VPTRRRRSRKKRLLFAGIGAVLAGIALVWYLLFVAPYESTDDAFIEGFVTLVSPRVPGLVVKLRVTDNERVKEGDVLVEIDPRDYETRLARARADLANAEAQLEQAKAQVAVDEAKAQQQHSAVEAAEAEAARAEADLKRYEAAESRAVSRIQLTLAQTQARSTSANLGVARHQAKSADAQASLSRVSVAAAVARVEQNRASLTQAELDLSYTKVQAPVSGKVTRRTVEQGIYVQTGQSLLALVPEDLWVVANFKETQLRHMRPGQPVRLRVDAFSGRDFDGKVDSIQSGTGARFSLLPPENAVGNYVKVVQRVPVKIVFDQPLPPELEIAPGMSVVPKVRIK
jgi:membrane fusion protein (multidrug efflux system)